MFQRCKYISAGNEEKECVREREREREREKEGLLIFNDKQMKQDTITILWRWEKVCIKDIFQPLLLLFLINEMFVISYWNNDYCS